MGRYEYDGLGSAREVARGFGEPGSPNGIDAYVHFFYNQGWQELESRRSTSENTGPESLQPQYQYVWSRRYIDAPVLRDKNTDADGLCDDERLYYLGDANFNVTTLVNTGGDALERYVYSPYGVLTIYDATWANIRSTSSYANAYTYTGRQLDGETGLYYYRARLYAAHLGRFCSRDPVGYEGGDRNLHWYAGNDPTSLVDPLGLQAQEAPYLEPHEGGGVWVEPIMGRFIPGTRWHDEIHCQYLCTGACVQMYVQETTPPWGAGMQPIQPPDIVPRQPTCPWYVTGCRVQSPVTCTVDRSVGDWRCGVYANQTEQMMGFSFEQSGYEIQPCPDSVSWSQWFRIHSDRLPSFLSPWTDWKNEDPGRIARDLWNRFRFW